MPTPPHASHKRRSGLYRLRSSALAAVGLMVITPLACRPPAPTPQRIAQLQARPAWFLYQDGAWFWLEAPDKAPARLMQLRAEQPQVVATAEAISNFTVEQGRIAWAARQGKQWTVFAVDEKGGSPQTLWSGTDEPMGLKLSAGKLYWLRRLPAVLPGGSPLPSLAPSLEVVSVPAEGGAVSSGARIWESDEGAVLGTHEGALYVALYRTLRPGNFSVVRIPSGGGPPTRICGEQGHPFALLAQDGTLYWVAQSQEVAAMMGGGAVRRRDRGGKIETIADWLPAKGRIYETSRGLLYADGDIPPALWRLQGPDRFPETVAVPPGYAGIAAGGEEALVFGQSSSLHTPTLYRMRLP